MDTKRFHTADVTGGDRFNQIFGQSIHRGYLVTFVRHNHVMFAAFDTGIQRVFLLTHQLAEIKTVDTELVEAWHDPSKHFVDVVTFGDNNQLATECVQESVRGYPLSYRHVTVDVA